MWRINIATFFPELFPGPLGCSVVGRAIKDQKCCINLHDVKDYGIGNHKKIDDKVYGGGPGMIAKPEVISNIVEGAFGASKISRDKMFDKSSDQEEIQVEKIEKSSISSFDKAQSHAASVTEGGMRHSEKNMPLKKAMPIVYPSPRGRLFNQSLAKEFVENYEGINLLCLRFEGVDARVFDSYDILEVSIGDYVLSCGDIAAFVILDTCIRMLNGVCNKNTLKEESFGQRAEYQNLLEYDHYTKPQNWEGRSVPEVLLSGNHAQIAEWRLLQAKKITEQRRPDLWQKYLNEKES